ncbi:MAG: hypothetical protein OEY29_16240 [Gammaproteobacteria bacterium]|nr:hypothetical protein [Gammaproteobacteria bacterium]
MDALPTREEQVRDAHALLIHQVVKACQNAEERPILNQLLAQAKQNGWHDLVNAINLILKGQRDISITKKLDEEDRVIISSILAGLHSPASLPDLNQDADPSMAAPGFAQMIHAARTGDVQALHALAMLAKQMTQTQGDMMLLGGIMMKLTDGERDINKLVDHMTDKGQKLVQDILDELKKLGG